MTSRTQRPATGIRRSIRSAPQRSGSWELSPEGAASATPIHPVFPLRLARLTGWAPTSATTQPYQRGIGSRERLALQSRPTRPTWAARHPQDHVLRPPRSRVELLGLPHRGRCLADVGSRVLQHDAGPCCPRHHAGLIGDPKGPGIRPLLATQVPRALPGPPRVPA